MDRCGVSCSLSHSSYISTGWSVKKQMEVKRGRASVEPHRSVLASSDTGATDFRLSQVKHALMLTQLQSTF